MHIINPKKIDSIKKLVINKDVYRSKDFFVPTKYQHIKYIKKQYAITKIINSWLGSLIPAVSIKKYIVDVRKKYSG